MAEKHNRKNRQYWKKLREDQERICAMRLRFEDAFAMRQYATKIRRVA